MSDDSKTQHAPDGSASPACSAIVDYHDYCRTQERVAVECKEGRTIAWGDREIHCFREMPSDDREEGVRIRIERAIEEGKKSRLEFSLTMDGAAALAMLLEEKIFPQNS